MRLQKSAVTAFIIVLFANARVALVGADWGVREDIYPRTTCTTRRSEHRASVRVRCQPVEGPRRRSSGSRSARALQGGRT